MIDEPLLLASALVHARPGAELAAVDRAGRRLVVSTHPSGDVDPCRWRAMVAAAVDGADPFLLEGMRLSDVGGCLVPAAGAGVRDRRDPGRRWFALRLPACLAVDVLRAVDLGRVPAESVSAVVRPDPVLGVTVVGLGVEDDDSDETQLSHLASAVTAAWTVAELIHGLSAVER